MSVQQTSIMAYTELKKSGELGKMQQEVLEAIRLHGLITDRSLSLYLRIPINCVTARRYELVQLGLVHKGLTVYDAYTHKKVIGWTTK